MDITGTPQGQSKVSVLYLGRVCMKETVHNSEVTVF